MWKACRGKSQQREPVESFWRRLGSSGGWDRVSGANPVTHPFTPQTSPTKSTCGRVGFTRYSVIITPLHLMMPTIWSVVTIQDFRIILAFNRNGSLPQEWWLFVFMHMFSFSCHVDFDSVCKFCRCAWVSWLATTILSHTCGSAMHIRCFIRPLQSTWAVQPVNHIHTHSKASTHIQHGIFPPKQLLNHNFWPPSYPHRKKGSVGVHFHLQVGRLRRAVQRCLYSLWGVEACLYLQGQK